MGRSQVARNRTQGRPGNKGRGRGKSSTDTNNITNNVSRRVVNKGLTENLGSNAWRIEREERDLDTDLSCSEKISGGGQDLSTSISTFYEETIQGRDACGGPSHDSIGFHSMDWDGRIESTMNNDNQNFSTRINTSLLSISLKNIPMAEWMRIPQRHVGFIDQHEVKNKDDEDGDGENATSIPHISLRGEDVYAIDPDRGVGEKSNKTKDDGGSEELDMLTVTPARFGSKVNVDDGNDSSATETPNVLEHEKDLSQMDEGHRRSEKDDHAMDDGESKDSEEDLDSWLDSVI